MRAMGDNPTEDELLKLVMDIDADGNGVIEFDEFVTMMKKKAHEVDDEADLRQSFITRIECKPLFFSQNCTAQYLLFRQAFQMFDSNHDGFIDMKELRQVTVMLGAMLTNEEVDDFMAEADKVENENVKHL